jgi:hypothetical protein
VRAEKRQSARSKEAAMKHQSLEQLRSLGTVEPDYQPVEMSRRSRLERWAELLEKIPEQRLTTLQETEHQSREIRAMMRSDTSPISVAFGDPILRAAGLRSDTYGEAKRFFEMTDRQLHNVTCYCHFGTTVRGTDAAYCVRAAIEPVMSFFSKLGSMFGR